MKLRNGKKCTLSLLMIDAEAAVLLVQFCTIFTATTWTVFFVVQNNSKPNVYHANQQFSFFFVKKKKEEEEEKFPSKC